LINEASAAPWASAGFTSRATIDASPEMLSKMRWAAARAKQGDREALRLLYVAYSGNVYGYVRSIVRDDHAAEDVTQQVFAKLITSLEKYDDLGSPFFSWLLRLARNAAIDHLRSNRLVPTEALLQPRAPAGAYRSRAASVRTALEALPKTQREVVILRYFVGLEPSEIAERTGRTRSSIHSLHHRGRRALQQELRRLGCTPVTRSPRTRVSPHRTAA
jgi:RNA polymerase sigma-70 factor (ECF subfamily)